LPFLLLEDGLLTQINTKIFSTVLMKLADNKNAAWSVARAVADNFDKLPKNVRNELQTKLGNSGAA
jgi:hypothetical protein